MDYMHNYQSWLNNPNLGEEGKADLQSIADNEKEIEYRFGGEMEFGTAGMRGIIAYGMNVMNIHTVMRATQGLAEWVKTQWKEVLSFPTIRVENRKNLQRQRQAFLPKTASRHICSRKCIPYLCYLMRFVI